MVARQLLKELNRTMAVMKKAFYEERRLNNQRLRKLTKSVANDYTMSGRKAL